MRLHCPWIVRRDAHSRAGLARFLKTVVVIDWTLFSDSVSVQVDLVEAGDYVEYTQTKVTRKRYEGTETFRGFVTALHDVGIDGKLQLDLEMPLERMALRLAPDEFVLVRRPNG